MDEARRSWMRGLCCTVLVREVTEPLLLRDGDGEALNVIVNKGIIVYSVFMTVIMIV